MQVNDIPNWQAQCRLEHRRVLTGEYAHYCPDWDYMTVDETTTEWESCACYPEDRNMADKLDKLRDAVRTKRDLDLQITALETTLSERKQDRFKLEHETLPEMFINARVTKLTIEAEGNLPNYTAALAPYYKAVISAEWPEQKQQAAFALLDKLNLGDLIKTIVEVQFGRDERAATKKFLKALAKLVSEEQIKTRQGVPWATLTAAIRYHYESGQQLSDAELATLGATVGMAVTLKEDKSGP